MFFFYVRPLKLVTIYFLKRCLLSGASTWWFRTQISITSLYTNAQQKNRGWGGVRELSSSGPADGQFYRVGSGHLLKMSGVKGHLWILCRFLNARLKSKATLIRNSQLDLHITYVKDTEFLCVQHVLRMWILIQILKSEDFCCKWQKVIKILNSIR